MSKTFTSRPGMSTRARGTHRGGRTQTNSGLNQRTTTGDRGQQPSTRGQGFGGSTRPAGGVSSHLGVGRGRGSLAQRQPGARALGMHQPAGIPGNENEEGAVGGNPNASPSQRISHQGAFSVITPNEKRRQKISEQARKETELYEKHKEQNKPGYVSYCGTAGGGEITQEQARRQQFQTHAQAKVNRLEKQKQLRVDRKTQEDSVLTQKKLEARRKAENNERREILEQERRRDEMRRKNNAFLDKLEKSQTKAPTGKISTDSSNMDTSSKPKNFATTSNEMQGEEFSQPMGYAGSNQSEESHSDLQTLQSMFPQYSLEAISDIYSQCHSLEVTAQLLSDS